MKKLCFIIIVGLSIIINSCSDEGSDNDSNITYDTSSMSYLEFMFDDGNGQSLNRKVLDGPVYYNNINNLQQKVNKFLQDSTFDMMYSVEDVGQKWWERYNIDANDIVLFLQSEKGQDDIVDYLSGTTKSRSRYWPIITAAAGVGSFVFGVYNGINMTNLLEDIVENTEDILDNQYEIMTIQDGILKKINDIDNKLTKINNSLIEIEDDLHNIKDALNNVQVVQAEVDLIDAKDTLRGFLVDMTILGGIDDEYRLNMIKDFTLTGYESMFIAAFNSAINRTTVLRDQAGKDVPFNMLLSDMTFMVELSQVRLSLASSIFTGDSLIQYRASIAKQDFSRALDIRRSMDLAYALNPNIDNEYLTDAMALIASWSIILLSHIEQVYETAPVTFVELESTKNVSTFNGYGGTFGDWSSDDSDEIVVGKILRKDDGYTIIDPVAFEYGKSISNLLDSGVTGSMEPGKYIRIVEDGENVINKGVTVISKNLAGVQFLNRTIYPPIGKCYIDPFLGIFLLPRTDPVYWSRCESLDNFQNADIGNGVLEVSFSYDGWYDFKDGLYGKSVYAYDKGSGAVCVDVYPLGKGDKNISQGAISLNAKFNAPLYGSKPGLTFALGNTEIFVMALGSNNYPGSYELTIRRNNENVETYQIYRPDTINQFVHYYLVWNKDINSIKLFINDVTELNYNVLDEEGSLIIGVTAQSNHDATSSIWVDNIKVWDIALTEDTTIINSLRINETFVDPFKPVLTGTGNGVGFYYKDE